MSRPARLAERAAPWAVDLGLAGLVSGLVTAVVFQVWDRPIGVPMDYAGDGLTMASVAKGLIETGWYSHNPSLGAPNGFTAADFPLGGENLHFVILKVLSWFTSNPFTLINFYFLGGFVLVACTAMVALRVLGVDRWPALAAAVLFSFLPAHFIRGTAHLFIGAYWSVPIMMVLIIWTLHDRPLVWTRASGRWRPERTVRSLGVALAVIIVGSAGTQYALFAVVLAGLVAVLRSMMASSPRAAARAAARGLGVAGAVLVVLLVNLAPQLAYQRSHGHNPMAQYRSTSQLDGLALRPAQLITPVPGHRIGVLASASDKLMQSTNDSEPAQFLGTIGTVGLFAVIGGTLAVALGRRQQKPIAAASGPLIIAMILIGVSGGWSWLAALIGRNELRAWGRLSVVIGFLSLAVLAEWASSRPRWTMPRVGPILCVATIAFGVFDQVPSLIVPDTRAHRSEYFADETFVAALETSLETSPSTDRAEGVMVFQLPQLGYPEEPTFLGSSPSDLLRPYLHSSHLGSRQLRWSFGGMRGRDAEWQEQAALLDTDALLDTVSAVGFAGVLVDRVTSGVRADETIAALTERLGAATLTSSTGRYEYFSLGAWTRSLIAVRGSDGVRALAKATLERPYLWYGDGFQPPSRFDSGLAYRANSTSHGEIVNPGSTIYRGQIVAEITVDPNGASGSGDPRSLVVTIAGKSQTIAVNVGDSSDVSTPSTTTITIPFEMPPGRVPMTWRLDGQKSQVAFTVSHAIIEERSP